MHNPNPPPNVHPGRSSPTASPSDATAAAIPSSSGSAEGTTTSYSSWTVPSLDNLYLARRASAFGARYGLISANNASLTQGRVSPAPSGASFMTEGGSSGSSLQTKARRMSVHMADSITNSLNDSSLVFYRVNEHIHKKVPLLVQEKKALVGIRKSVETANQDMEDARQTISSMQRISELSHIEDLVKRALAVS
ncbi:hypothetical protein BGZ68_008806 [Mortierella alpina]|nr:hypothetical protein BGZ68_008806 [Mortierella alpina]